MNKRKLVLILSLVIVVALSSFMLFGKKATIKSEIPEWVPQDIQAEIKSLNPTDPMVKLLISEIQSTHVKDPQNPPQELISRIEGEIKEIKYQKSI